jgi:hypothetical protein
MWVKNHCDRSGYEEVANYMKESIDRFYVFNFFLSCFTLDSQVRKLIDTFHSFNLKEDKKYNDMIEQLISEYTNWRSNRPFFTSMAKFKRQTGIGMHTMSDQTFCEILDHYDL